MTLNRRDFLRLSGAGLAVGSLGSILDVGFMRQALHAAILTSAAAAKPITVRKAIGRRGESMEVTTPVCRLRAAEGRQRDTVARR